MTITQKTPVTTKTARHPVQTLDIIVLAGGPGAEREVSLCSGRAVYEALKRLGHRVVLCDMGPDDLSILERHTDPDFSGLPFVFIALHGEFGEDGTIQARLDARGLPYAGSEAVASRVAMNKAESKRRFQRARIPTPPYEVVDRRSLEGLTSRFPVPAVVKPSCSGSSVDTSIARTPDRLRAAAEALVVKYGEALVERYIDGPELTVGILGDQALPVCEIRTDREFYDYEAKYIDDDTQYLFDLDLSATLLTQVQALSLRCHRACGCSVFSRVDWMVDAETLQPYVLEVNTIPGFTSHSLLPKAAYEAGLSFEQLCQRIVDLSLARWDRKVGRVLSAEEWGRRAKLDLPVSVK